MNTSILTADKRRRFLTNEPEGLSFLDFACVYGNADVVEDYLETSVADMEKADERSITPFMRACVNGNDTIVHLFLKAGTDINAEDSSGRTALYLATLVGEFKTAELLIQNGARLSKKQI